MYVTTLDWAFPERIQIGGEGGGRLRIHFFEILPWNFLSCHLEIPEKTNFHLWKFSKSVWHPLENPRSNPRPIETPHQFFLNTEIFLEFSTSFLIDPWNFHMLFLQYLWKHHALNPSCLDFLWNSPFWISPTQSAMILPKPSQVHYCGCGQNLSNFLTEILNLGRIHISRPLHYRDWLSDFFVL